MGRRWGRLVSAEAAVGAEQLDKESSETSGKQPASSALAGGSEAWRARGPAGRRDKSEALLNMLLQQTAETQGVQAIAPPGQPRRSPGASEPSSQRPGEVHFPVISEEEQAAFTVPASAPPEKLREVLELHGVCLVTGVLNEQQCAIMEKLWLLDLEEVIHESAVAAGSESATTLLQREGLKAWRADWCRPLGFKGAASQRGLPHGYFAWGARMHPSVRQIFADIFQQPADELVVGLDNVFWAAPDSPSSSSNPEWLHVDQNHCTGLTWPCYQGVLYVWPSEGSDCSTTVLWPGSHREAYEAIMNDTLAIKKGRSPHGQIVQVGKLRSDELRSTLLSKAMQGSRRLTCPAGSLLLWDSRTVHQGWAGGPRLAQPICWEPRQRRKYAALGRKLWMCAAGVPSSHAACEGRVHGMATRERPKLSSWSMDMPMFREMMVPFGIAPGKEEEWRALQDELWKDKGDPRQNADRGDRARLLEILRPDVVSVL
mmetsp:Transcript_30883/g.67621  ORF Transcript_30883/g.67621 Transcript_30883/m.67621 type:complete len:486 (-) Transcript_30883:77-1534(-)